MGYDIQTLVARRKALRETLTVQFPSGFCHITSVNGPNSTAGTLTEFNIANAARAIAEDTHRLSTEAELKESVRQDDELRAKYYKMESDAANAKYKAMLAASMPNNLPPEPVLKSK